MSWLPNWILGTDPEDDERRGLEADEANQRLNQQMHDQGLLSDENYRIAQANIDKGRINDASAEIDQAFLEGLDEGAGNIRRGIGGTINTVIGTPLKLIPLNLWLIIIGAAAFYFWPVISPIIRRTLKAR
jgi:hypothetical protein